MNDEVLSAFQIVFFCSVSIAFSLLLCTLALLFVTAGTVKKENLGRVIN